MIVQDFARELYRYPLEDIAAVVSAHIRNADFFPKLRELIEPLEQRQVTRAKLLERRTYHHELPWDGPDAETRRRSVDRWKKIKASWSEREQTVNLKGMPIRKNEEKAFEPEDIQAVIEADRKNRGQDG